MLLVIHNLPKMMRYEEVKDLIRNRCNLTDIIVDNLVLETTLTRKVTIGLTDESDAAIVFKELNGLVLGGRKILVEDVRKQQGSGNRYKQPLAQDMMQTQYASYSLSSGGNYSFTGMGTVQNTQNPCRGVPSPYDNNQQQIGGSSAPDYIPFNAEKPNYNDGKNDRYFNWKGNDQPSDVRGSRSSYSNDGNDAVWSRSRSDEYPRYSDSNNAGGSSMRDPYKWYRGTDRDDRRSNEDAGSTRLESNYSRQCDDRQPRFDSYDRPAKRLKGSHFEKPSARNDLNPGYSGPKRGNQGEHSGALGRGYQNRPVQMHPYKNASNKAPYSRGQDFKPPRNVINAGSQPWSQPKSFPPPKVQKNLNPEAIRNKDETWRGQAVSAIVKDMLIENGMSNYVKKQVLLNYIKPMVRARIDKMIGKRVAVPLEQIIEEYKRRNPPRVQTKFIIEERKKYELTRLNNGEITNEEYEVAVNQLNAQLLLNHRRPAPLHILKKQNKAKPAQKRVKTPPPPPILPRYPNSDKKEYKKLRLLEKTVPGVYDHKLDPKMKKAIDDEILILCDIVKAELQKHKNDEEKNITSRMLNTIDFFKEHVKLSVTKRVLNITKNLPLMAYTEAKVNSKEVKAQLKEFGIETFRKSLKKNAYVASCRTFEQYDHFCSKSEFVINGQKIVFRPIHSSKPPKKKKVQQNENADNEPGNEDDGDDNDCFFDDGAELSIDEDGMIEEIIDDEDHEDEKKDIQVNRDKGIEEGKTGEVQPDCKQESKGEIADIEIKTESKDDSEEASVKTEMVDEKTDGTQETDETEETLKGMNDAETAKLLEDIHALSNIINEENEDNDDDINVTAEEKQNITHISQDDLEDF